MAPTFPDPRPTADRPEFDAAATLDAILATRRAARIAPTLEPAPTLDHRAAKARALAVLAGGDPLIAARQAFDALAERNRQLVHGGPDEIRCALADQIVLLEATVTAYTLAAARERRTENRRALAGVALRASTTLTQALLALHRVSEDQRNGEAIPI